jgi:membrane-associated phospholipid phosphatase
MNINLKLIAFILLMNTLGVYSQVSPAYPTGSMEFHPYRSNYWASGIIITTGLIGDYFAIPRIKNKGNIADSEFRALDRSRFTKFDRWALHQEATQMKKFARCSDITLTGIVLLPALLTFDGQMRNDWLPLLMIYLEAMTVTFDIYNYSFLGPTYQNKYRPAAYYDELPQKSRNGGYYRSSFYSGHMATTTAATFFVVKAYSDYHPEIGEKKYLLYGLASLPPLLEGYFRVRCLSHFPSDVMVGFGLGALCGIIVPELHKKGL